MKDQRIYDVLRNIIHAMAIEHRKRQEENGHQLIIEDLAQVEHSSSSVARSVLAENPSGVVAARGHFSLTSNVSGAKYLQKPAESFPGYPQESWLSRDEISLMEYYQRLALSEFIQENSRRPMTGLMIGAGRGYASIELMMHYPYLKMISLNKEDHLLLDRDHLATVYEPLGFNPDALSVLLREGSVILDLDKDRESFRRMPDTYDVIIMGEHVAQYLHNQISNNYHVFL